MEKRINGYAGELKTIRAGRANASVLDKVAVSDSTPRTMRKNNFFITTNIAIQRERSCRNCINKYCNWKKKK